MENLCKRVRITLEQRLSNGQNYAIVCANLTYQYLWYVIREQHYCKLQKNRTFWACSKFYWCL